mgnify:CR=1 FL=1|jgi:hypothetical protein
MTKIFSIIYKKDQGLAHDLSYIINDNGELDFSKS